MKKPIIIAILPAYNAINTFEQVIERLPKGLFHRIILSDDCSEDGTFEAARRLKGVVVVQTPRNVGYGGNVKFCFMHALPHNPDIIVEIHPDGEYGTDTIVDAVTAINKGAHLVLGNRFIGEHRGMYAWKRIGVKLLTIIDNIWLGTHLGDLHQGFRVYSKKLLTRVPYAAYSDGYIFSFEMIVGAVRSSMNVDEVPVKAAYTGRKRGAHAWQAIRYAFQTFRVLLQ